MGELANLTNVSRRTIDFYTRIGLIRPSDRTEGNFRLYDKSSVQRIRYIHLMKAHHLTLEDISQRLELFDQHTKEVDPRLLWDRIQRVSQQLAEVEQEIFNLTPSLAKLKVSDSKQITSELATQVLSISQAILLLLP